MFTQWIIITWKLYHAYYTNRKRIRKDFEIKYLGEHLDLYVQSNRWLLAGVFENFQNICLAIYELDPPRFLTAPKLAWQAALKKAKIKLDLFTDGRNMRRDMSRYSSICKR